LAQRLANGAEFGAMKAAKSGSKVSLTQENLGLKPALPLNDLQDLALWGSRAKDADGLDHGYWQPWGPPCDVQNLDQKELLSTFSTWLVKQLRMHRDAVAQVASTLQRMQQSLFHEEAGKVDFASALAVINGLPTRLDSLEDSAQTLLVRVNKLSNEQLKRASSRGSLAQEKTAKDLEIHDKPAQQAVKECREAVNLMLEMQRNFTENQESLLQQRLAHFEEEFRKAGVANVDEIAFRFGTRDREMEGIYARVDASEFSIQKAEESLATIDKWKDQHSYAIFDLERRSSEAENQLRLLTSDVEDHAQELLAIVKRQNLEPEGAEKSDKPEKIASDGSNILVHRNSGSLKKGEVRVDETIVKDVADAKAAAEKASESASAAAEKALSSLSSAQELQKEMASIWQALQNVRSTSPKDVWPHRNARLGRLPNLPPSSLAQEEADRQRPYPEKDSELEKVQQLKERFFPPTGGCFRTGTSHRYRSRKRPATAQMQLQVLRGGGSVDVGKSRPLTAGNERRLGTGDD